MRFPNFSYEKALIERGFGLVAGVDEAGTGALAGPVVAGAAIVPFGSRLGGIRDSKLLSPESRRRLLKGMSAKGVILATGVVTVEEIATMSMRAVATLAMRRALETLPVMPAAVVTDAFRIPGLRIEQVPVIRGDRVSKSVAAASIAAKVTRDETLIALDREYPGYGFAIHKGYGTAAHLRALERFGPSPIHRKNFAPVRAVTH